MNEELIQLELWRKRRCHEEGLTARATFPGSHRALVSAEMGP